MKADKALQNIVYKLVPGLYQEEMEKRRVFTEENEPTKVPKAELEKHFFFCHDSISMSLEYYDGGQNQPKNIENNPNKRYLACPGTVKIQHLMKFIIMKYGLNEDQFVVDVIYNGDIIPDDYTLIDVAYYYKWAKDSPMQFFYRIFKKNKVLLKRRKRKSRTEDKISDPKKSRPVEVPNNNNNNTKTNSNGKDIMKENNGPAPASKDPASKSGSKEIVNGCRTVQVGNPPSLQDETKKLQKKEEAKEEAPPVLEKADDSKMEVDFSDDDYDDELKIDLSETIKNEVSKKEEVVKTESKEASITPPVLTKEESKSSVKTESKPVVVKTSSAESKMIMPKLTTTPNVNSSKPRSNHNMLTDIVNNLAKKQANTLSKSSSEITKQPPPSLLGGQTTITKKEGKEPTEKKKKIEPPLAPKTSSPSTPKGIPSGTSVTVRSILPPTSSSSSSSSNGSSTTTVSFSNSFKSKNGSTSMMDFVQAANNSNNANGLSPTKKSSSSTLSDLRQFRKDNNSISSSKTTPPASSSTSSNSRTPIIPSLTLGKMKSPTNSSSSSALSKPIPKAAAASCLPPSVTTANSFFAAQAAAAAALAGLDPTNQLQLLRTIAMHSSMSPALSMPPHPLLSNNQQQLPASRLKLVQTSSSGSTSGSASMSTRIPPSLASHIAPDSQWKMFSNAMSNGSSSGKLSSYTKTLNQSIRQIPNPSLLTKQANSDQSQQQQLLHRAMQVAAAASAAAARTTISQ